MTGSSDTPMMRQYQEFKSQYPEQLLLFRMGDFFEVFFADAEKCGQLLNLTVTKRGNIPMAGVPVHSLDNYLARLLKLGESVVICDQTGAVADRPGNLMERKITRIVTPGTLSEEELLPAAQDNLVAAAQVNAIGNWGLAWMDVSNGRLIVTQPEHEEELIAELSRRPPAELLLPAQLHEILPKTLSDWLLGRSRLSAQPRPDWEFDQAEGKSRLLAQLQGTSLAAHDCADLELGLGALGALLCYAAETIRSQLPLDNLIRERRQDLLFLDPTTRDSLEIDRSLSGDDEATLLSVLDTTSTPMGARLLRQRLQAPTRKLDTLKERHDSIEALIPHPQLEPLRKLLRTLGDLSRALSRIHLGTAPPRDLLRLRNTLNTLPDLRTAIAPCKAPLLQLPPLSDGLQQLSKQLHKALVEAPPATIRDGGVIAAAYDKELDELRDINTNSSKRLAQMEKDERARTGISKLKAGYNRVHGYYLEIPRNQATQMPPEYRVRQTLKNTQRYITPDLKRHEEAVLSSQARALEREKWLYRQLLEDSSHFLKELRQLADCLAELDFLACNAERAINLQLQRPQFSEQPGIRIRGGRHPVVEQLQKTAFTPNDLDLTRQRLLLITGPNMGGKSTYMRQTALLILMAYAGCFVAAEQAVLGPIDRILTRIGASDRLGRGQSTFMVEMTEVAYLLRNASPDSLVLLDEVGRGTGTQDGEALSWACLLWFGRDHPCHTLFATHFAGLTEPAETLPLTNNVHFDAEESDEQHIRFLHRVRAGSSGRSYGLQVAHLAGVPSSFLATASKRFQQLETATQVPPPANVQTSLFAEQEEPPPAASHPALQQLAALEPDDINPKQALEALYQLKKLMHS